RPSPSRRASETAARQSTATPSESGVTRNECPPAVKATGTRRRAPARLCRRARASSAESPPTLTPATRTPAAIRVGEPANRRPIATLTRTRSPAARAVSLSGEGTRRRRLEVRMRRVRAGADKRLSLAALKAVPGHGRSHLGDRQRRLVPARSRRAGGRPPAPADGRPHRRARLCVPAPARARLAARDAELLPRRVPLRVARPVARRAACALGPGAGRPFPRTAPAARHRRRLARRQRRDGLSDR